VKSLRNRLARYEDDHDRVDLLLSNLGLVERFPEATLEVLDTLVPDQLSKPWTWFSLRTLLDQIGEQVPELRDDARYRRLDHVAQAANR